MAPNATQEELDAGKGRVEFIDLLIRAGLTVTDDTCGALEQNDPEALADLWTALRSWPRSAPRFECPALLYAGDRDEVRDALREYASTLPNARFRSVPDADHGSGFSESGSVLPFVAEFLASSPAA
jgi:pimeloyl-ACP methyl ester carboxylesterase